MNKKIPKLKSEDEERDFWATHNSNEYVDWKKAQRVVLPGVEALTEDHIPQAPGIDDRGTEALAHKKDVPTSRS